MTVHIYDDTKWASTADRQWADKVRWRLAIDHPASTKALIEQILGEAQIAVADSGHSALELFGTPENYAQEVATERIPDSERAKVDMDGIAPEAQWQGAALALGFVGIIFGMTILIAQGFSVRIIPWQLVLVIAGNVALFTVVAGLFARRSGRIRNSWMLISVAFASLGLGAIGSLNLVNASPIGQVSTLIPLLSYAGLLVFAWLLPEPKPQKKSEMLAPERWFAALEGMLRGRYYLSRSLTAQHVSEARETWTESGTNHPQDVLGRPEIYAAQLIEGSAQPHQAKRRFSAWALTTVAGFWVTLTIVYLVLGEAPGLWRWSATMFFVLSAIFVWLRVIRSERNA